MRERTKNIVTALLLALLMVPVLYVTVIRMRAYGVFANDPKGTIWLAVLFLGVGVLVNSYAHTLLHELGHLIFGLFNGFFAYSFRIGPFTLTRSGAGSKLSFSLKNHYGTCIMVPKTSEGFYRRSFLKVLGGPAVSLLLAVGGWLVLFLATSLSTAWYAVLGVGAAVHSYMFLRESLPYTNVTTENDGAQLLGIAKRTPKMQVNLKLFAIQCLIMRGTRPGEIDESMFFDVPVLPDNCQERLLLENYRYLYHLDRGEIDEALACGDFIEQYADEMNEIYRPSILADIFFNYAYFKRDVKKAADLYWDVEKYLKMDHNVVNLRVRMAHELYVEELPKRAAATGQEALKIKDGFIMRGVIPLEEKLVRDMLAQAEAGREEQSRREGRGDTLTPYRG